ncbi:hypothetical protein ACWEPC_59510, partial [Nonomuraea sp. NPDC004297]
ALRGQPEVRIRVETEVVLTTAEPVGAPSNAEWEEEVLVDFAAAPGGTSAGGSLDGNGSTGFNHPAMSEMNLPGGYQPSIGPRVRGNRSASQSYSSTANAQAIHPSVLRKTRHTQGYRLELRHTFTIEKPGGAPITLPPMTSSTLARMQESAAFRFGLPVDAQAALQVKGRPLTHDDGTPVLRGEVRPVPIKGRKSELPAWLGDGPGQMRGSGPALVQELTGLDGLTEQVLDQLAESGVVPKIVNGVPQYSSNHLTRASQMLNLQEVMEQLTERRLRTAYDQLAQEGILVDLVLHGRNQAPDHHTLRISLVQDFSDRGKYVGVTDAESVVNLDIGTDTSARGVSRSRTYGGGGSVNVGD